MSKQPYMVKLASSYYKKFVNNYGISHFYSFKLDKGVHSIETSVPDGCIDIIFNKDMEGGVMGASIYGSPLSPHPFDLNPGYEYFGVRFLPGNSPIIIDASASELINRVELVSGAEMTSLVEEIGECHDFNKRTILFLQFYLSKVDADIKFSPTRELNYFLVNEMIKYSGNIRIEKLSEKSGYSVRYVNRVFKDEQGIAPKSFCRILRFQSCMSALTLASNDDASESDFDLLVSKLGYSDQSHLIREFKEFSMRTPKKCLDELNEFDYRQRLKIVS